MRLHPSSLLALCLLGCACWGTAAQNQTSDPLINVQPTSSSSSSALLWSSTGGGWRAMFADIGYANAFQQAGLFDYNSTRFTQLSTVSGGSWFSTQLTYSAPFYNSTAMATSFDELEQFVLDWMATYYNISTNLDNTTIARCNTSDWDNEEGATTVQDICELLTKYNYDWAYFIQEMLDAAAIGYGDPTFAHKIASPGNRIAPMSHTDLLIQACLAPNSRIRESEGEDSSTAVYVGRDNVDPPQLFTAALSAAFVVEDTTAGFVWGTEDLIDQLQTYTGPTPVEHSWSDWDPFFLYDRRDVGTLEIDNSAEVLGTEDDPTLTAPFRTPFGGSAKTTTSQIASISSAAGAQGSPLIPSIYSQFLSIGAYEIEEAAVDTAWRVLAGLAAGIGAGCLAYFLTFFIGTKYCTKYKCCTAKADPTVTPGNPSAAPTAAPVDPTTAGPTVTPGNPSASPTAGPVTDAPATAGPTVTPGNPSAGPTAAPVAPTTAGPTVTPGNPSASSKAGPVTDAPATAGPSPKVKKWAIALFVIFAFLAGVITGVAYGFGLSIIVPTVYDKVTDNVYQNNSRDGDGQAFDNFAVCSQWPNTCGVEDGFFVDGWYVDNPAVVTNVGHYQQKRKEGEPMDEVLKLIVTNTNTVWDTEFNYAQLLQYWSTDFNLDVKPGDFLWAPGYYAPYRSPQIFSEYLDQDALNAALVPIPDSNMTTALLTGTTLYNPSFGTRVGQTVEMLLLNLNENITTFVVGEEQIEEYTQPLADMTVHIASSEELVRRVREFAES